MNKNFWLLLFFILCCPVLTYAGIKTINDTPYASGNSATVSSGSSDDNSLSANSPKSQNLLNSSNNSNDSQSDSQADGDSDGDGDGNETYPACYFSGCENYSSCQYYDINSLSVASNYCSCAANNTNIALCDSQLHYHSTVNYSGYARGLGVSADSSLTLVSGQNNYYYLSNVDYFCPVKLNLATLGYTLNPLSQTYYTAARSLDCDYDSSTGVNLFSYTGINCIRPGYGIRDEQIVNLCIYGCENNPNPYDDMLNYENRPKGLQFCDALRNQRDTSSARSFYSMDSYDDLPAAASTKYYMYRPNVAAAPDDFDYQLAECAIRCGVSGNADITPICQGWYYLQNCSSFTAAEEAAGYYISPLYNSYAEAVAAASQISSFDICYNFDYIYRKSTFIRCGIKHSADATNGVYSETECRTNNGVCSDTEGDNYTCGGETYCKRCVCQSGLYTLAEWCAANNITEDCDTEHYKGQGNGCNYDDTSSDLSGVKYASWILDPDNPDNVCQPEGQYVALEDISAATVDELHNTYGPSAQISKCISDNTMKWQITCSSDYAYICGIVDTPSNWCTHGHDSSTTMRSEAASSSPHKYCTSGTLSGICGESIIISNGSGSSLIPASYDLRIYETESPEQCYNRYGRAASVQPCISIDNYGSKYNCYYDLREYIYSTTNDNGAVVCPVRHDLTGNYIVLNGQKRWAECNCMGLYDYTIYTCSGNATVMGKACTQNLSNVNSSNTLINKWKDKVPYDQVNNRILVNSVDLYPYCQCDERFKYTCDDNERTSPLPDSAYCQVDGRYYYESCQCTKDSLPDHWSDNYFNCTSGAQPTGIWKEDGCGGKMYQCSDTIVCTSEYTQTCNGTGQIGVSGYGCQDDEGAYVKWKKCQCDTAGGWHTCLEDNQSGVGDPCISGNVNYYQSCSCPSGWATCDDEHIPDSSVQSCQTDDGIIVYASCGCNSNYSECSGNGQVGDTSSGMCTLSGGTTVYENCICKSEYDKTCQADSSNHIRGDDSDVCTISGSSGETENYYKSCRCEDGYILTCSASDHLVPKDSADYCQTASGETMYYNECECASGYDKTCEGQTPADINDYCSLNGVSYYTACTGCDAASGWIICSGANQIGDGQTCTFDETTYYQSCICPSGWTVCDEDHQPDLSAQSCQTSSGTTYYESCICNSSYTECGGNGQVGDTSSGMCVIDDDTTVYERCICNSEYNLTCQADSGNHIHGDADDVCSISGSSGEPENYYKTCQCDDGYTLSCSASEHLIPKDAADYCQIVMDGAILYNECQCASGYTLTCSDTDHLAPKDDSDYCQTASGETKYYNECECASGYDKTCSAADGLSPVDSSDYCSLNDVSYYTACTCDTSEGWVICDNNQIGNGPVCTSGGTDYYQSCSCPEGWVTCNGDHQSGNEPACISGGTSYYQSCSCPAGWVACGTNQIGNGTPCVLGETEYYQSCSCPSDWTICTDNKVGDPSLGSCTIGGTTVYENCICPSHWITCETNQNGVGEVCTSGGIDYYSSCICPIDWTACSGNHIIGDPSSGACAINGSTVYESCACDSGYTENCLNQAPVDENDYCSLNGVSYYTACTDCGDVVKRYDCGERDAGPINCIQSYWDGTIQTTYASCDCSIPEIYDGRRNTEAIIRETPRGEFAADVAYQYHPSNLSLLDNNFGIGRWYLPAYGEMYQMVNVIDTVNSGISAVSGEVMYPDISYWSSSEVDMWYSIKVSKQNVTYHYVDEQEKRIPCIFRIVTLLENKLPATSLSNIAGAAVGDVVYSDLTYDSYTNPHSDKTPVGVVYWVSSDKSRVRIVSPNQPKMLPWGWGGFYTYVKLEDVPTEVGEWEMESQMCWDDNQNEYECYEVDGGIDITGIKNLGSNMFNDGIGCTSTEILDNL